MSHEPADEMPNKTDRAAGAVKISAQAARPVAPVLEKMYQFLLWLIPTVEKFPKSQKFLLGDRLQTLALDVQEHLIEASYTRDKVARLAQANLGLEKLRILFRLAYDLQLTDQRRYEFAARAIDEIGRMVGGWLKGQRAPQA